MTIDLNEMTVAEQEALIQRLEDPVNFIELFLEKQLSNKQKLFIESTKTKKHVVAIWSRQTGKSTVIACYIVWRLLYGPGTDINGEHMNEHIAILAPIKEQLKNLYAKIRVIVDKNELIYSFVEKINTERILMKNGNSAMFMSASPGSHIRGYTATCIVIDESQDILDSKYSADILPFGSTTNALVIEAGTPKTKNHFFDVMKSSHVTVIKQPWFDCPFISQEYVMRAKETSTETLWRQEYMCEFIEEGVMAFPSSLFEQEIKKGKPTGRWNLGDYSYLKAPGELSKEKVEAISASHKDGALYSAGCDLGRQNDNTVYTIWKVDCRPIKLCVQLTFPLDTQFMEIARTIGFFHKVYQPYEFNLDYTNEKSFVEMLKENNVPIVQDPKMTRGAVVFTARNKIEMVNNAKILFEQFQLQLPKDNELMLAQFMNQQFEISDNQKYKFFHPSNEHDDILWSSLLALKNVNLLSSEEITDFVNPWDKYNETHHSGSKATSEVLVVNDRLRRKNYEFAEFKRGSRR